MLGSRARRPPIEEAPVFSNSWRCTTYTGDPLVTCCPDRTTRCGIRLPVTSTRTTRVGAGLLRSTQARLALLTATLSLVPACTEAPNTKLASATPTTHPRINVISFINSYTICKMLACNIILTEIAESLCEGGGTCALSRSVKPRAALPEDGSLNPFHSHNRGSLNEHLIPEKIAINNHFRILEGQI